MNDIEADEETKDVMLEFELDAPPEKVWRAISIAEFREKWLPKGDLTDDEPVFIAPGEEIRYRMRDNEPPYLESVVAFQIVPNANGGTVLKIIHGLTDARLAGQPPVAANSNRPVMMRAA